MSRTTNPALSDTAWLDRHKLTAKRRAFVIAFLETNNAIRSAEKAGYAKPDPEGARLLADARVRAAVDEGRAMIQEAALVSSADVLRQWFDVATADPRDLVQHIHGACRYCHGVDHQYQWRTEREYRDALAHAVAQIAVDEDAVAALMANPSLDPRLPTDAGGYGYRATRDPHPDCPECDGIGVDTVRIADTRNLKGGARLLYDGIEETRQGKKIKIRDRDKALENIAKHLGMFAGKVESEETNPLQRLAQRIMEAASTVPVADDASKFAQSHTHGRAEGAAGEAGNGAAPAIRIKPKMKRRG